MQEVLKWPWALEVGGGVGGLQPVRLEMHMAGMVILGSASVGAERAGLVVAAVEEEACNLEVVVMLGLVPALHYAGMM